MISDWIIRIPSPVKTAPISKPLRLIDPILCLLIAHNVDEVRVLGCLQVESAKVPIAGWDCKRYDVLNWLLRDSISQLL